MFGWIEKQERDIDGKRKASESLDGVLITGQTGFFAGTHVASNLGWRAVDALAVGDSVLTFDHGMQTIVDLRRETIELRNGLVPETQCPILIPLGVLNNRTDMWVMPDQGLLVESDAAMDALGDPFAVVPARALVGLGGIRHASPGDVLQVTTLSCSSDEVVYVEGGMLAHCPRTRSLLMDDVQPCDHLYDVLGLNDARFLADCLAAERPQVFGRAEPNYAQYA